jgi:ComF family protein
MASRIALRLLDFFAPRRCLRCQRLLPVAGAVAVEPFCSGCASALPWWRRADGCPRCGWDDMRRLELEASDSRGKTCPGCYSQGSALHRSRSLLRYEGDAQRWIRDFKSGRNPFGPPLAARLATEFFADELARIVQEESLGSRDELIVPIPLHPRRHRARGFNQSALIAARIARRTGFRIQQGGLVRRRATRTQAHQRGESRRANLRHAFALVPRVRLAPRVILVDDVLTTGTTLEVAAETLLAGGVEEVCALTLAATLPFRPNAARLARWGDSSP